MASLTQMAGAAGLGLVLGGKVWGLHKLNEFRKRFQPEHQPAWNNRRSFARLPKRKQRELIYRKRQQLRDYEGITYGPQGPRRRRGWFGS